jgi:hypothetical protein
MGKAGLRPCAGVAPGTRVRCEPSLTRKPLRRLLRERLFGIMVSKDYRSSELPFDFTRSPEYTIAVCVVRRYTKRSL